MKKIIFLTINLFLQTLIFAQPDSLYQIFNQANQAYQNQDYTQAIALYNKILHSDYHSSELYYNLANAYFKEGQLPYAILYYEKALLLNPHNKKAKENLKYVKTLMNNNSETPEFILDRIYKFLYTLLPSDTWAILSIITFVIALFLGYLFLTSKIQKQRKYGFIFGILFLIISATTLLFSVQMKNYQKGGKYGILMEITTVKSSPTENGTDLFVAQPGIKVKILEQNENWYEVKLPNQKVGWIEKNKLEKI